MNPEFVQFKTSDGLLLPGLLYGGTKSKKCAIYLHGNGSSSVFYEEVKYREMAEELRRVGVSLLLFNNRGAHIIKKLDIEKNGKVERRRFGMAFEVIKECVLDINGAIEFLEKRGFREFYLIGSSTGANKICVYDHYVKKNEVSRYILVGGADDTGIYYQILGKKKFFELLKSSKEMIKKRRGEELIADPKLFPEDIFSYQAFFDIANPDGDYNTFPFGEISSRVKLSRKPLFRYFKAIGKPTLVIYGERDEYTDTKKAVKVLKEIRPDFGYKIIEEANHGFEGKEKELASVVANWLRK